MASEKPIYPELSISKIKTPNRYWAIPVLGGVAKIIILIPVFVEIVALFIYIFLLQIINSFYVLFGRKYWQFCFDTTCGALILMTKTTFFFEGLTDKYPGFNLKLNGDFDLKFTYPQTPRVFYAIPVIGGLARGILLIPFAIYSQIISNGAKVGVVGSSVPVLLNGKYPDSTFELARDSQRLSLSAMAYFAGISDQYPSFKISMNNQTIKIFLIIVGTILLLSQWQWHRSTSRTEDYFKNPKPYIQNMPNNYTSPRPNYR